ncbi:spore germination protein [Ectobacillus funiculus]|uniref:GerAB/ArcD/ProY family transporter n=1 Tax=Ectobacillus funiculus TaxID=137993 RepID=UPI00397AF932
MYKISAYQLFVTTFIFQLGTGIIFGSGGLAGRDAWISQLVSIGPGILVIMLYITLMRMNPGLTLVQWFPAQFGRWIGIPIAFLYPLLFLYQTTRVLADIRDMISTTLLFNTPLIIVTGIFVILILYIVYSGIEIIARFAELLLPFLLVLFIVEIILLFSSDVMHINNLQPILENGWGPIWEVVYPGGIHYPYGTSIIFAMFWTEISHPEKIMKITVLSAILSGIMIAVFNMLAISVFGSMFSHFLYPLYTLLSVISVGNFIENLQIIGVIYFFTTAFIHASIEMFAALKGFQQLTRIQDYRVLIIPAGIIALFLGMAMSKNISEHYYYQHMKILVPYIWTSLHWILPIILLIVTWLRQKVFKVKKNV